MSRRVAVCGTPSGYQRHRREGTDPCSDCTAAVRVYNRRSARLILRQDEQGLVYGRPKTVDADHIAEAVRKALGEHPGDRNLHRALVVPLDGKEVTAVPVVAHPPEWARSDRWQPIGGNHHG